MATLRWPLTMQHHCCRASVSSATHLPSMAIRSSFSDWSCGTLCTWHLASRRLGTPGATHHRRMPMYIGVCYSVMPAACTTGVPCGSTACCLRARVWVVYCMTRACACHTIYRVLPMCWGPSSMARCRTMYTGVPMCWALSPTARCRTYSLGA
ncbi:hypothetical protein ORF075L [Spotted knifejaw iridovirus]|uniref:ORF074L n=1 Tax=Giant seaperch iridovirus TaxID=176655 RepID=A0A140GB62_GSIV|nr:ORF074L [giant sea perch iridovirus - K1]WBR81551.1 hypothetical protein ORF075L [Spotted knifejaw iridovirus]